MRRWIVMDGDRPVHYCAKKQAWIAGHHAYLFEDFQVAYRVMGQIRRPYYQKANRLGNEFEAQGGVGYESPGFKAALEQAERVRIIPVVG